MVERSDVTFGRLRQFLLDLGFTESQRGKHLYFEHAPSKVVLAYRAYGERERVLQKDLLITRQDLDWHNLMKSEAFDQSFAKVSA